MITIIVRYIIRQNSYNKQVMYVVGISHCLNGDLTNEHKATIVRQITKVVVLFKHYSQYEKLIFYLHTIVLENFTVF